MKTKAAMTLTPSSTEPLRQIDIEPRQLWVCESQREWVARLRHHIFNHGLQVHPLLSLDQWFSLGLPNRDAILVWEYRESTGADTWRQLQEIALSHPVFAVCSSTVPPELIWLRALGIAAVFPGPLSCERLLRLAERHFETRQAIDKPLEERIQYHLPWPQA